MRNKLILFLMLALFGSTSFLRADEFEVQIGEGTSTTGYFPFYTLYNYSMGESLYLASELEAAGVGTGDMTSLSWYATNAPGYAQEGISLWMANVTDTDLTTTSHVVTGMTLVYTGTVTPAVGWNEFVFNQGSFAWDGTSSILILCQRNNGAWNSTVNWQCGTVGFNGIAYKYQDSGAFDVTVANTVYVSTSRPNIIFKGQTGGGGGGELVEVTIGDPTSTTTNQYLPGYSLYDYAISQQIYTADEIGVAGSINTLTVWLKNTSNYARNINVYMKEVEATEFASNTAWESFAAADMVASFTMPNQNTDPIEVALPLNTPFEYSGTNSLAICFQDVTGQWSSGLGGVVMDANGNQALYAYRDGTVYDPSNPGVAGTLLNKKNVIRLAIETSSPEPPTGGVSITPNPVALGDRPTNGWMEPVLMRIHNGLENTLTMTGNMSNTSGIDVFTMSEEINNVVLEPEEDFAVVIDLNQSAVAGDYAEQFTLFYIENRDITLVPVTATVYDAVAPDIVEEPGEVTWSGEAFTDTPDLTTLHANYNLYGMTEMKTDAVYHFTLAHDYRFHATGGDDFIAVYNVEDAAHLNAGVEPVLLGTSGIIDDEVLLDGEYYLVVASENISNIEMSLVAIPEPTAITYIAPSPANGAMEVEAPVVLAWEGGENATEYQILFGTSPVNMDIWKDWTMVDNEYGVDTIPTLQSNTQYFWQINVRNSEGNVNGPRWGFTSTLTTPHTVSATPDEIFNDETTLIKWKHSSGTGGFTGEITVADGTATSSYVPVYGLWMDDYTRGEMIYPAEMLEEMQGGEINKLTYYISSPASGAWSGDVFNVYLMEVEGTTLSSYYTSANATIVYTGALDGQGTTMVINFDQPYVYEGGNLLVGIEETVCGTYKSCSFYGVAATGASASGYSSSSLAGVTFNQRDFLPKTTFTCGDAKNSVRDFQYYNVYVDGYKYNADPIYEKEYILGPLAYNMTGYTVAVTAVYDEGESSVEALAAQTTLYVSGYSTFTGHVNELISNAPMAGVSVKFNGTDEFGNNVAFEGTTDATGKYTINNVKTGQYVGLATFEGMEPAGATEETADAQTLVYNVTSTVDFKMHEVYVPVMSVVAEEMDAELARVRWSLNEIIPVPNPGGNTPGGGSASSFTEGFESGMPADWSVIDGNNDGWTWCLTSAIPTTWTYYASLSLDWYRTGTNAICSGSYINGVGALTPNEYLVMGQQNLVNGSTLSFWAAATDASYPADHFGVFVSDDASDWTSVQEWTLTGKGTRNGGRESRDGNGAKIGTWYNYSVDLSAYAGQKYIAIRHFNCNDQYIMCVDDIELSTSKGTRDVEVYNVYRAPILTEDGEPLNVADIEDVTPYYIASVAGPDTLYADFDWANMEPGLYQYGVAANYPIPAKSGNRTEIVYDFENGSIPSDFTNTSSYPWVVADANGGKVMKSSNGGVSSSTSEISLTVVYPTDGTFSFDAECMGEGTSTFWDKCTFSIDGAQQFQYGANHPGWFNYSYEIEAGEHTFTWSYSKDSSVNPTGDYFAVDNVTISYLGGGGNDDPETAVVWSNVLPKDIETTVVLNAQVPDASAEGVTVRFNNVFENTTFTITLDETGTDTITDFRKGEYMVTFDLLDYNSSIVNMPISIWEDTEITAVFEEIFKPITSITASRTGYVTWDAVIPVDRVAENYVVLLDGTPYAETVYNYIQIDEDDLTVGETYQVGVRVMYTTGISEAVYTTFTYADCESAAHQVEDLTATNDPGNTNVTLAWNGATPTPPTPPTPPTGGWTEGFESGLPSGWNVVDGNNDGWTWCLTSAIPSTWTYYASVTLDWYRTGTNAICSGSYINGVGALTPDEYLVMGQQSIVNGSTLTFWAAAADASYPADHFGVFVSDNGTSGWTSVQEWTLTGKGTENGGRESRDGKGAKLGSWHQFTADLSAFAGSTKYIAIRHFNCNDQYIMVVDDIEFTGAKRGGNLAAAGLGYGNANNALTDDGNWYYYDNGVNEDAIGTGGGNFWWGIMLPAGSYEGNRLTKVAAYDYMAMSGNVNIYQGGSSAPAGSSLGQTNVTFTGSSNFVEFEFAEPIELDPDQNVWVVFYNGSGATYPAAVCANTGDANGRWVSLDGSTWEDLAGYSLNYTFMVRAYIESGSGPAPSGLVPNKYNIFFDGELVGATASNTFTYDAADFAEHEYVVIWVDSDYLESCIVDGENKIDYAAAPLGVAENMINTTIYPNPTDGEIRINANNMERISIVNALGQVVYDKAVEGNEAIINMAQFGNGVYMVNIATENGTSVKRVIVSK